MKVYIAGKITGLDTQFVKEKFAKSEWILKRKGHKTVNPTRLVPINYDWQKAMDICLHHLKTCDAIYMQEDWQDSKGAVIEHETAIKHKLKVIYEEAA